MAYTQSSKRRILSVSSLAFFIFLTACNSQQPVAAETPIPEAVQPKATIEPEVIQAEPVYLADLWHFAGYGAGGNFSLKQFLDGGKLEAHGRSYPNGIWAHANSAVEYRLYGQYQNLKTDILLADWEICGDGAIFRVNVDGNVLFESEVFTQSTTPQTIDVDLTGGQTLRLETSIGGNNDMDCDWAIWGDPVLMPITQLAYSMPESSQLEFFVSPDGDDSNPGTIDQPFATLERAQAAVRAINQDMTADLIVNIRGGRYELTQPFYLNVSDSGTNGHEVIYQAYLDERPVLSGGSQISGWSAVEGSSIWSAPLDSTNIRQLYVNGRRAQRAHHETQLQGMSWVEGDYSNRDGLTLRAGTLPLTASQNLEVHWVFEWMDIRLPVEKFEETAQGEQILWFSQPYLSWAMYDRMLEDGWYNPKSPFYLENAFEFLDQPGEWYYDELEKTIYYMPLPDEEIEQSEFLVPESSYLLAIEGKGIGEEAHNITIRGLTFQHSSWTRASTQGVFGWQSQSLIDNENEFLDLVLTPSAIEINAAHQITFENNVVEHIGSAGLWLVNNVKDSRIVGNIFRDISDSALVIGMAEHAYENLPNEAVTTNNLISNNRIIEAGVEYWGAPGISAFYVQGLEISHNDLSTLPYSAISIGWGWSSELESTTSGNSLIAHNRIDNFLTRSRDGGGIYTLGQQPGTVITGNYISNLHNTVACLYLDGGSAFIELSNNVCVNVPMWLEVPLYEIVLEGYDNIVSTTYTTTSRASYYASVQVSGTVVISIDSPPEEAQTIINEAGLEVDYKFLLEN